uniref:Uncharacterized protein n=2 Tax=Anguilla anguilla TaxID=7936 RepID=A0A0E9UQD1_ANGAN
MLEIRVHCVLNPNTTLLCHSTDIISSFILITNICKLILENMQQIRLFNRWH